MADKEEQRGCIKFCAKLGKTAEETLEMLKTAYGENTLGRTSVFKWHKQFKEDRTSTDDDPRPSTSRNNDGYERSMAMNELIKSFKPLTIQDNQEILDEQIPKKNRRAKFPHLLSQEQKIKRVCVACKLLHKAESDKEFLKKIITGDETWVFIDDPETERSVKITLIVFFDVEGIVHYEYVPEGKNVNEDYYIEVLKRLIDAVCDKRRKKSRNWAFHHDNASPHTARSVQCFLKKRGIPVIKHPPWSPDMAPCDFWLFPQLKNSLKGKKFEDIKTKKKNTTKQLKGIPKNAYKKCFEDWQTRWRKCIDAGGDYFEV